MFTRSCAGPSISSVSSSSGMYIRLSCCPMTASLLFSSKPSVSFICAHSEV